MSVNVHLSQMAATARAVGAIETGEVGAGYGDRDGDRDWKAHGFSPGFSHGFCGAFL